MFNASGIAASLSAVGASIAGMAVSSAAGSLTRSALTGDFKHAAERLFKDVGISCAAQGAGIVAGGGQPMSQLPVGSLAAIQANAARAVVFSIPHSFKGEKPHISLLSACLGSMVASKFILPAENVHPILKSGASTALVVGTSALLNHSEIEEAFVAATHSMLAHMISDGAQQAASQTRVHLLKREFDASPIRQQMKHTLSRLVNWSQCTEAEIEQALEATFQSLEQEYRGDFKVVLRQAGESYIEHCVDIAYQSQMVYGGKEAAREVVREQLMQSLMASEGDITKMYQHLYEHSQQGQLQSAGFPLIAAMTTGEAASTLSMAFGGMVLQQRLCGQILNQSGNHQPYVLADIAMARLFMGLPMPKLQTEAIPQEESLSSDESIIKPMQESSPETEEGLFSSIKSFFKPLWGLLLPKPYIFEHNGPNEGYQTSDGQAPKAHEATLLTTPPHHGEKAEGLYEGDNPTPDKGLILEHPEADMDFLPMYRDNGEEAGNRAERQVGKVNLNDVFPTHAPDYGKNKLKKFVEKIRREGIRDPIKYVEYQGKKYVVDGHHRLYAARQLKLNDVPFEEVKLPFKGYKSVDDLKFSP